MPEAIIRGTKRFYQDMNVDRQSTIVFIHGHPFDHTMWSYQLDAFKDFRLILPDLRGYGRSETGIGDIYLEEQALDIALLLDQLAIDGVQLIGLSMGGQIAVEFARLFIRRTRSIVISSSSPAGENSKTLSQRLKLADTIQRIGMLKHTRETIEKYLHPDTTAHNDTVFGHLYKMMVGTTAQGASASHRGRARRRDNVGYLKSLHVPVLFLIGDRDAYVTPEEMQALAKDMKNAGFMVIPNAGHMPNMEQPEIFNREILRFYQKHQIILRRQ